MGDIIRVEAENKERLYRSTFTHNGKRYERTSTASQKEANKKTDKLKSDLEDGFVGISKQMRVSAWAYEWLETCKRSMMMDKCKAQHKRCIDKLIVLHIWTTANRCYIHSFAKSIK